MGWVSPTGFVDPESKWENETNIYDENTGTYCFCTESTKYLELTHAAINCDKVQVYLHAEAQSDVDIDLYYDAGWNNIWSGSIATGEWVEKTNAAGTKSVTAARIKFNGGGKLWWCEFDFNEVEVVGRSFGFIIG